jgi:D-alanine-D-alanine ligase-like ATP-grasp enzyme
MPGKGTSIIVAQRKAKKNDRDDANFMVRNLDNGFVYVLDDDPPECVRNEAVKALESTELAFGAVDVIYNEHQNKAYVLEINTAPGLEQRTAEAYAKVFQKILLDN